MKTNLKEIGNPMALSLSKKLFFSFVLMILVWGFLEVAFRVWFAFASEEKQHLYSSFSTLATKRMIYQPHPYLSYMLRPGYKKGKKSHNSLGYRGKEITMPKPKGLFRIVAIGGSTTYTAAVHDDAKTYPAQLERILQKKMGRHRVDVVNAGVSDYTTYESLINLQFRVLDLKPNLIVVHHSHNDFETRWLTPPEHYSCDNTGYRKHWSLPDKPWWDFSLVFRIVSHMPFLRKPPTLELAVGLRIADDPDKAEIQHRLRKNTPHCFRRNLINIAAVATAHNVKVMFTSFVSQEKYPLFTEQLKQNRVIEAVAEKTDSHFFDYADVMPLTDEFWEDDGLHLMDTGALRKAKLFADFIYKHYLSPDAHKRK